MKILLMVKLAACMFKNNSLFVYLKQLSIETVPLLQIIILPYLIFSYY